MSSSDRFEFIGCFVGVDGRCKMGDFGLIVDLTSQDREGFREGDSKYLAPEVLKGNISKVGSLSRFSRGIYPR